MRVAYLTGEYPRASHTFIQREVAALREGGMHVQTFSIRRPPQEENLGPEQHADRERTTYILPCPLWTLVASIGRLKLTSPRRYFRALKLAMSVSQPGVKGFLFGLFYFVEACVVAEKMRRDRLTHLHNHFGSSSCTVAMLAAELGGFTFSFSLHGPDIFFEPYRWRLDEKLKRALFVCCISHFCRSQAMIFCPPQRWDRLHILHCGIDPGLFKLVEHHSQGTRLLTIGRLVAVKGLPVLLNALKQLVTTHPDLILTIVGDGPDRAAFEKHAKQLGLEQYVRFLGYQSQSQVREHLKQADVFVLPSFAEGVPVVLMEAMASGVPVVTTRIAGIAELVDDGQCGYLVPPGDTDAVVQSIDTLLTDPNRRSAMGRAGRDKVAAQFNLAQESAWLRRVMTSAIQGRIEPVRYHEADLQTTKTDTDTPSPTASSTQQATTP